MSGQYDNYYQQTNYSQYPQQGYSDYNQSYQQSSYPSLGFSDNRGSDQSYNTNSSQSYYNSSQPQHTMNQTAPGAEADRGLLGALAGGAAGGYGGHKVNHGFLGTIGGAIVGSLAEDFGKKKHKQNKHHSGYSQSGRRDASQSASGLGSMASSFFNQKR